jgi:hypothetical protein
VVKFSKLGLHAVEAVWWAVTEYALVFARVVAFEGMLIVGVPSKPTNRTAGICVWF